MDCVVREATENDFGAVSPLFAEGDAFHCQALPHLFQEPKPPGRSRQFLMDLVLDKQAAVLIAEKNDEIVGLIQISLRMSPSVPWAVPRRYLTIDSLVVRQACRRAGIGLSLVRAAEGWAKDRGTAEVELNLWEFNTGALTLYEQLGYTTARRTLSKRLESG